MIKILNGDYYIKNTAMPKKFLIKIEAGFSDSNYKKTNNVVVDINPKDYIKGGTKSTGDVKADLKNYIVSILDLAFKSCYFDMLNTNEAELTRRVHNYFLNNKSKKMADAIIAGPSKLLDNLSEMYEVNTTGYFSFLVIDAEADLEVPEAISKISSALTILTMNESHKFYLSKDNTNKLSLDNLSSYKYFNLAEFINALVNVFMFYACQGRRDLATAFIYDNFIQHTQGAIKIMVWDNLLQRYDRYCGNFGYTCEHNLFDVSKICSNIDRKYTVSSYPESYPFINKYIELKDNEDKTYITSQSKKLLTGSFQLVSRTRCNMYKSYKNKEGVGEAVSISLSVMPKEKTHMYYLNTFKVFTNIRQLLEVDGPVSYDTLLNKMTFQDILDSDELTIEPEVAFFTRGRGSYVISAKELVDKSIPKQRRDLIYAALSDFIFELDLNPLEVLGALDVDFKRFYKEPVFS